MRSCCRLYRLCGDGHISLSLCLFLLSPLSFSLSSLASLPFSLVFFFVGTHAPDHQFDGLFFLVLLFFTIIDRRPQQEIFLWRQLAKFDTVCHCNRPNFPERSQHMAQKSLHFPASCVEPFHLFMDEVQGCRVNRHVRGAEGRSAESNRFIVQILVRSELPNSSPIVSPLKRKHTRAVAKTDGDVSGRLQGHPTLSHVHE